MRMGAIVSRLSETLTKKKNVLTILALLLAFPLLSPSRYYMILLAEVLIWALLAMSYDLTLGYTGLVSFGHAAMFGIGAYASAILLRLDLNFGLAILVAMLFGALIGFTFGILTLRVSGIYYALVTLAVAEVIFAVFSKWVDLSGGETGLSVPRPDLLRSDLLLYAALIIFVIVTIVMIITVVRDLAKKGSKKTRIIQSVLLIAFIALLIYLAPSRLTLISEGSLRERSTTIQSMNIYYFLALIPLIISYFAANRIVNSPVGRIFVAIRENEERTRMVGYNVFRYKLISSIFSGIFAGLAGALYAPFVLSVNPANVMSSSVMINVLLYSILGGLGTLFGPMIGAAIITLLASELTGLPYVGEYWMLVLGIFYLIVIMFLPYGIVITWKIRGASFRKTLRKLFESIRKSSTKVVDQ
jgi:branched-chain amino acid transport system permease protein